MYYGFDGIHHQYLRDISIHHTSFVEEVQSIPIAVAINGLI